jgi:hypothetical protein
MSFFTLTAESCLIASSKENKALSKSLIFIYLSPISFHVKAALFYEQPLAYSSK